MRACVRACVRVCVCVRGDACLTIRFDYNCETGSNVVVFIKMLVSYVASDSQQKCTYEVLKTKCDETAAAMVVTVLFQVAEIFGGPNINDDCDIGLCII